MSSTILRVDPEHPDPAAIAQAAAIMLAGGLVAFPTETVYGLGADAFNAEAVAGIYAAKGRPAWNPVIAHVPDVAAARALAAEWSDTAQRFADAFWPGPLTLLLPKAANVPDIITAGLPAVAVRVPAHPVALALLRAVARPIAAPSANRFTQLSPTTAAHVLASLGDRVPLILDGGASQVGIESTIVDVTGPRPVILRPGMISRSQLEAALGAPVDVHEPARHAPVRADDPATVSQRAPGMSDRHYAPRADVWLFDAADAREVERALTVRAQTVRALTSATSAAPASTVTALLRPAPLPLGDHDTVVRMPDTPAEYAHALYAALHSADARGAALIVIERPPDEEDWSALRDRLARAAQ